MFARVFIHARKSFDSLPPNGGVPMRGDGWALLRLGSYNARGLSHAGHAADAAALWRDLQLDVVFVQETNWAEDASSAAAAQQALEAAGWVVYYTPGVEAGQRASGGTAITVRSNLLAENGGALTVVGNPFDCVGLPGRLTGLDADWRGHKLRLASIYLPSGRPSAQQEAINGALAAFHAAARQAQRDCVWGGDFNFCADPTLDRLRLRPAAATSAGNNTNPCSAARAWHANFGATLVDVFRVRSPTRRRFSHFSRHGAARLDRLYVSVELQQAATRADVARLPAGASAAAVNAYAQSDHRPVYFDLLHAQPITFPAPPTRVRFGFRSSQQHWDGFVEVVSQLVQQAPPAGAALVAWWPGFKARVATAARAAQRAASAAATSADTAAAAADLDEQHAAVEQGDAAAAERVAEAAARAMAAAAADEQARALREQRVWVQRREYPHPGLTRQLRRPAAATRIAALRDASGALHTDPPRLAATVAQHWAAVSAAPQVDEVAQRAVLAAVEDTGIPAVDPAALARLHGTEVSEEEVGRALSGMRGGTAPGLDGFPLEFYRYCAALLTPLLASLFTAMLTYLQFPVGFTEGLITCLPKQGPSYDPANYRPITLLGTDYRIFARVLVKRLAPAMAGVIDAEQTAFLPGRHIGQNLLCLQLLPAALVGAGRSAYVAFCDFQKAYDTVDRNFLFSVMQRLGFGGRFLSVVRLLLTGTASRARVNGCVSAAHASHAGVRQGCPLAPLLYLFVGHALQRWLRTLQLGVSLPGVAGVFTALQFADDTEVFLDSPSAVRRFVFGMARFAAATGQRLHMGKTVLLPVGAFPEAPLSAIAGLAVANEASALGLTFRAGDGAARPTRGWEGRLEKAHNRMEKARSLRLSAMGRGIASAAYAVSVLLYHAEFVEVPEGQLAAVHEAACELVLKGARRTDAQRRVRGACFRCPKELLTGSPSAGGWGVLALAQHVNALRARWAGRLVNGDTAPWAALARHLLSSFDGSAAAAAQLPGALQLIVEAVSKLPPPQCRPPADSPLASVEFGQHVPLVTLLGPRWDPAAQGRGAVLARGGVRTLGALVAAAPGAGWSGLPLGASQQQQQRFAAAVELATELLPPGWRTAGERLLGPTGPMYARHLAAAAAAGAPPRWLPTLERAAVWRVGARLRKLGKITVAAATQLQLPAVKDQRRHRFQRFAESALSLVPAPAQPQPVGNRPWWWVVQRLFRPIWALPCANSLKEVWWPLVYHASQMWSHCACGATVRGREHMFWLCPVARAVVAEVQRCLARAGGGAGVPPPAVRCHNIWLGVPPPGHFLEGWLVVATAALSAMEYGRCFAAAQSGKPRCQHQPCNPAHLCSHRVSIPAVEFFWGQLRAFCALGTAPVRWRSQFSAFFRWTPAPGGVGGLWAITRHQQPDGG